MAARKILQVPNPLLGKECCRIVFPLCEQTREDIHSLKSTLREEGQRQIVFGLSAPQIGVLKQVFVVPKNLRQIYEGYNSLNTGLRKSVKGLMRSFEVFINPEILGGQIVEIEREECLSVNASLGDTPLIKYMIPRYKKIRVRYFSESGNEIQATCQGLLAKVIQHELDHLHGVTIDLLQERTEPTLHLPTKITPTDL